MILDWILASGSLLLRLKIFLIAEMCSKEGTSIREMPVGHEQPKFELNNTTNSSTVSTELKGKTLSEHTQHSQVLLDFKCLIFYR